MGHNYSGKSVEHTLRRFLNDSEPISLKNFAQAIFKSNPNTGKKIPRPFDM